jgi:hypothetical protein
MMDESRFPLLTVFRLLPKKEHRPIPRSWAYAGRYRFTCDKVVHHVEIASLQN